MTAIEITFVLFLNIFTVLVIASLAYVTVVLPLRDDMSELKQQLRDHRAVPKTVPHLLATRPPGVLPDMDEMSDKAWEIGDYGEFDHSTPDEVEEEMSELQIATREADMAWQDLESMKHGKRQPLIYSGG